MPRKPNASTALDDVSAEAEEEKKPVFTLKKSAGFVANGRTCHHFSAGTQFDAEADAATIAALIRAGAIFE